MGSITTARRSPSSLSDPLNICCVGITPDICIPSATSNPPTVRIHPAGRMTFIAFASMGFNSAQSKFNCGVVRVKD